jgi:hypothetical protein
LLRFECDIGSVVADGVAPSVVLKLFYTSQDQVDTFNASFSTAPTWASVWSSVSMPCGGYATYHSSAWVSDYHVCSSVGQFANCL